MNNSENPRPQNVEEISAFLKEKRLKYSDLPELLAALREPESPAKPKAVVLPADAKVSAGKWSEQFFAKTHQAQQVVPTAHTTATPASPDSLRSQLAALEESLKREQRYRQQFEEASAKAAVAEGLHKELQQAQQSLQEARHRESTLQSEIAALQTHVTRAEREAEAIPAMQDALKDAQLEVESFSARLKEAELKGALVSHLEAELTKARLEITQARQRESDLASHVHEARVGASDADSLRVQLESTRLALSDASNREETLQIQLAEAQGAITIARQIESELANYKTALQVAEANKAGLAKELEALKNKAASPDPVLLQRLSDAEHARHSAEARIRELQGAIESARTDVFRHTDIARSLQLRLTALETELQQSKFSEEALRRKFNESSAESSQRITDLSDEIAALHGRVSRISELEMEIASTQAELQATQERETILRQDSVALSDARAKIVEIEADLAASKAELLSVRQSEQELSDQLRASQEVASQVANLEAEITKIRQDHAGAVALIDQLRMSLARAEEAGRQAQELRREISIQVIALREAEVRRHSFENRIAELEAAVAATSETARIREQNLLDELGRHQASITGIEAHAAEQSQLAARREAELIAQIEAVQHDEMEKRLALESMLEIARIDAATAKREQIAELETARELERQLAREIEEMRMSSAATLQEVQTQLHQSQIEVSVLSKALDAKSVFADEREAIHLAEVEALRAETGAQLEQTRAEIADREIKIASLTKKLTLVEADAARLPELQQEIASLQNELNQSKIREDELAEKLAAIERAASEIAFSLPKVSYGPDYQLRKYSTETAQHFSEQHPYRAPRIIQWIGHHPKQTLLAVALVLLGSVAGAFFLYQPSYRGLVDAPVNQLLSPVTGTVITANGEPGVSVQKGESLFTLKNANDGRELVRAAKDHMVALEEEVTYLESIRAGLLQRQLIRGVPGGTNFGSRLLDDRPLRWNAPDLGSPDAPDFAEGNDSSEYLAARVADVNAKLEIARTRFDAAKAALAKAEEEFRANEKAEVVSPVAGAIQTMRVTQGSPVEPGALLAEIVSSEEAFIETALPQQVAEKSLGRKVTVILDGSKTPLEGEIVSVGTETGWNSKQTAVSLDGIPEGYVIVDIWIAGQSWSGDAGFASQIGRKAKITLK